MEEIEENRFSHLLKPIRDLAQNWNIDIASELQDYLDELETITISFDGLSKLNFAQAALLIQGSTLIYSRKVEYLHTLVYQVLSILSDKRCKQAKSVSTDHEFKDDQDFLILDDILEESHNIDLQEMLEPELEPEIESETQIIHETAKSYQRTSVRRRKRRGNSTMNFRTPSRFRLSTPGSTQGDIYRFENRDYQDIEKKKNDAHSLHQLNRTPASMVSKVNPAESSRSFRLCNASVHKSGALLLEDNLVHTLADTLDTLDQDIKQVQDNEEKSISNGVDFDSDDNIDVQDPVVYSHIEDPVVFANEDSNNDFQESKFDEARNNETAKNDSFPAYLLRQSARIPDKLPSSKDNLDPWRILDPHEESSNNKPFKKGRTFRAIDPSKSQFHNLHTLFNVNLPKQPLLTFTGLPNFKIAPVSGVLFPEFSKLFKQVASRRQHQKPLYEFTNIEEHISDCGDEDNYFLDDFEGNEIDNYVDCNIDVIEQSLKCQEFGTPDEIEAALQESNISYESLVRSHVESYLKEAEEFAIQTNLSRRVASWQLKLEPILEEQSQRPPFDINKYGDDVLNVVHEKRAKEKTEKLPFEEIVCGRETYDVCRMFLASLQLANNGSVEIDSGDFGFCIQALDVK